jgi:thiol-disulfide isomerase/thioredoxin
LLSKEVVARYGGKVRFVSEDWGGSQLAARFGIKRYPVVFVDDVLVAQPKDFGGWGVPTGKYAPWRERASQERFKSDLVRVVDLLLAGDRAAAARLSAPVDAGGEIATLPPLTYTDLDGNRLEPRDLAGRVVVVEVWATWCAPCRSTLPWLRSLERELGDRVVVLAVAVQSPETEIRKTVQTLEMPAHVIPNGDDLVASFGGVTSVPVLFVFDGRGKTASVFVGAPDDLHERAGNLIRSLAGPPTKAGATSS